MSNEINIEKIKEIINDFDKGQVVIFINCTIENITIAYIILAGALRGRNFDDL